MSGVKYMNYCNSPFYLPPSLYLLPLSLCPYIHLPPSLPPFFPLSLPPSLPPSLLPPSLSLSLSLQRTAGFDLYMVLDPLIDKSQAIIFGNKLIRWISVSTIAPFHTYMYTIIINTVERLYKDTSIKDTLSVSHTSFLDTVTSDIQCTTTF